MLGGLQLTVSPVDGDTEVVRLTAAVNPYLPAIVTVKLPVLVAGAKERMALFIWYDCDDPLR
jgi:hypothetical protein